MSKRRKARLIVLQALYQYDSIDKDLSSILKFNWVENKEKLPKEIFEFATEIICGTNENMQYIDNIIQQHLNNWKLEKLSPVVRSIIRFSVYSIFFQKNIPPKVIINEAVVIAKQFGEDQAFSLINALLDSILADSEKQSNP